MTDNLPSIIEFSEPFPQHLIPEINKPKLQTQSNRISTITQQITPPLLITDNSKGSHQIEILQVDDQPLQYNVLQKDHPCIVQIIYPEDIQLSVAQNAAKRGRPKKKNIEESSYINKTEVTVVSAEIPKRARTRSGRLVKLPKHIEKDFKKIEVSTEEQDVQVSDFKRFDDEEKTKVEFTELQVKKRVISAQYRCPKCLKAYLGKNKMIQHLKKYPDHGPLPENYQEHSFDVWNYLFDITQKCKSGQKGVKFCEELSNLLHNVQLLKSALFKADESDGKNCVNIDKVLGNAIGLQPGKYKFDENELYKDVTVLKLITNKEFFKFNNGKSKTDDKIPVTEPTAKKIDSKTCDFTPNHNLEESQLNTSEDNFSKKDNENQQEISSDMDELLTTVGNGSTILDSSSDEVMNVDQFVNERFKKIIEPDIELGNASLNLDLPSLDLFHFHAS